LLAAAVLPSPAEPPLLRFMLAHAPSAATRSRTKTRVATRDAPDEKSNEVVTEEIDMIRLLTALIELTASLLMGAEIHITDHYPAGRRTWQDSNGD
jgi:hypothetical protein